MGGDPRGGVIKNIQADGATLGYEAAAFINGTSEGLQRQRARRLGMILFVTNQTVVRWTRQRRRRS